MSKCKRRIREDAEHTEIIAAKDVKLNPSYAYGETYPYECEDYDPRYGNNPESCRRTPERTLPSASLIPLATAYIRPEPYGNIYTPSDCLKNGTCFPELDLPYTYEEDCCCYAQ